MKKTLCITFLLLLSFLSTICLAGSITFTEAEDSHIVFVSNILHNDDNYGNSTVIRTANNGIYDTFGLIKFVDIFGTEPDQISTGANIISADLHLWMSRESAAFPNTIKLYQLVRNWDESTVTERNYGSILDGIFITSYSKLTADSASLPQELVFDVTASLLSWQTDNGDTVFGWGIESQTLHAENYFYSSESADYQPFLVLNYDSSPVPAPGTILLLCAGLLGLSGLNRRKMKE